MEEKFRKLAAAGNWPLTRTDGKKGDFLTAQNELVELKSDKYDINSTSNLFIEWWSDIDKLKPGGPLQAKLHGAKYFVYFFVQNNTAFVYNTDQLCKRLLEIDLGKPVEIRNVRWVTVGYKINRALLQPLFVLTSAGKSAA